MAELTINFEKLAKDAVDAELKRRDLVQVVRCRDCKFAEEVGPCLYICNNEDIVVFGGYVNANWYCADGKRGEKTDEGN